MQRIAFDTYGVIYEHFLTGLLVTIQGVCAKVRIDYQMS